MTGSARETAALLRSHKDELSEAVVDRAYREQPEVWSRYGEDVRRHCVRDAGYHLSYLAEAVEVDEPSLFVSYAAWVKVLFHGLDLPEKTMEDTLRWTQEALKEKLAPDARERAVGFIDQALEHLPNASLVLESHVKPDAPHGVLAKQYLEALLRGERARASQLILDSVAEGVPVEEIYLQVFQPVQYEVGRLWQTGQISVAQEHYCTACTQLVMSQLYPQIVGQSAQKGRMVAACVGGELHEIGMRMVTDLLELSGWDTYYLGANMPTASILDAIDDRDASLLGISTTITYHLPQTTELIRTVRDAFGDRIKVMVGGYPFRVSESLWQQIGADGFAPDAESAVQLASSLGS